jgi:long-chain acyl-CoA synthetase
MLDLREYNSLGAALRAALDRWPAETCLIEADRDREKARFTYAEFKAAALPLARALQNSGFAPGARAAILMTNQSKWLLSAYAVFYSGGVVVPLDYKLAAEEQLHLLAHSKAEILVTEHHVWRALAKGEGFDKRALRLALVAEAPANADLAGARRWEEFRAESEPAFVESARKDIACIVYSSGTGGRPKGCMLTHENYLEQCAAVTPTFPFWPGARYLSIIPTNHAIDFMGGFIMPFTGGGTVVHLRTLRPEYIREAFTKYKITYMAVVPLILKNLQRGLEERFTALPPFKRRVLNLLIGVNRALTKNAPNLELSRRLFREIHAAFGGGLHALLVGGAFTEPKTIAFFHDLGIPIYNGYGCTEACTAITLNDQRPFRPETVGRPVPGMEVRVVNPDAHGVGEVVVRSKTVMAGYLDDPEMTAATIVDGWLMTGDLGCLDASGELQLFGRKKNMIVTEEGKNVYPEDVESAFAGLPVKEFCVFAANYIWPEQSMAGEKLVVALHADNGKLVGDVAIADLAERNRRLANYKRVSGYVIWERDFPLTASMKIKRAALAEEIRAAVTRDMVKPL